MQRTGAHFYFEFAADFVLYYSHDCHYPPTCSLGHSPLNWAIDENKPDVAALLRSVSASQ
jgi:hypothetical protein